MPNGESEWIELAPDFGGADEGLSSAFIKLVRRIAGEYAAADDASRQARLESLREELLGDATSGEAVPAEVSLQLATSVVIDLLAQGWDLKVDGRGVAVRRFDLTDHQPMAAKAKVRRTLMLERAQQLNEPAAREFIRDMETRRLNKTGWVSIFSLMRDGRDLAERLRHAAGIADLEARGVALRSVVQPYLQFVTEGEICAHTGLRLVDIWRYFRMTWSTAYKPTPGRRMLILIRDAAAANHPVIGIGGLSSSVVQLSRRDAWIGWHPRHFIQTLVETPTAERARWVLKSLSGAIQAVYSSDLLKERVLSKAEFRQPTPETITRLYKKAADATRHHHLYPKAADIKAVQSSSSGRPVDWSILASSALYLAKRAKSLARLLAARLILNEVGFTKPEKHLLTQALESGKGRGAIGTILREVKAKNVGVGMMDISVCGAVPPYSVLLGGKLVATLLASPEVVREYRDRYSGTPSLIASSMQGRAVVRPASLVLLGTTSLYSTGASQYNRIRIPAEAVGGRKGLAIEYVPLGETLGWGSFHFSKDTLRLIEVYVARSKEGRRVNSIFGEGVNPRLRKIRQGFDRLGLPEELLKHGTPRLVFMVPLTTNFRDVLLELAQRPKYILPQQHPRHVSDQLAEWWRGRWLAGRICREGILDEVARHSLAYPVEHGARVSLPAQPESLPLFNP